MLDSMTAGELADWIAYYDREPWGETRADLRLSVIAQYTLAPHMRHRSAELPKTIYPYYEQDSFAGTTPQERLERIKELRQTYG